MNEKDEYLNPHPGGRSCPLRSLFFLSFPPSFVVSTLLHLCLLLAAFSALVSSKAAPPSTLPAVYSNCSGNNPVPLPRGVESTPFFKPQIRINPLDINKNGTGWEE